MKRTRFDNGIQINKTEEIRLDPISLLARYTFANRAGYQYGGDRNLYEALGYKTTPEITYKDYLGYYKRHEIAQAVINRPAKATWQGSLELEESRDDKETPFEIAWKELEKRLKLKSMFHRVDRLTGIGNYGVLLLGFNDVSQSEDWAKPVGNISGIRKKKNPLDETIFSQKLIYVKSFGQGSASIKEYEQDTKNPRYGLPTMYSITMTNMTDKSSTTIQVHYTRVIHVVEDPLESEIEGDPTLQVVFNRLMDIEKIVGGDAEMFWRGARPGYAMTVDKDATLNDTQKIALKAQFDEYEHNLRRFLTLTGVTPSALAQQIADPTAHFDMQLRMISAVKGIPKRILEGSERGELSSRQDADEWDGYVQSRRGDHAEPHIVRPFVDRMIELGILPKPGTGTYTVKWNDLFAKSEDELVTIGLKRAQALAAYNNSMLQDVFPLEAFMQFCLGLDLDQIDLVTEMIDAGIVEEQKAIKESTQEPIIEEPIKPIKKSNQITSQMQKSSVDWKKIYADGGAHWTEDLQPTQFAQEFAQELITEHAESLLEIGCANGRDSILFAMAKLNVIGIDIVPKAIKLAKENAKRIETDVNLKFQVGNVEELTFEDNSFDAVYSLSALHSTDMNKSLSEIFRVLKSKGLCFIHIYSNTEHISGKMDEFVNVDEYIELLKSKGFIIEDFYTHKEDEYDDAGERHSIIVTKVRKA